MSDDADLKASNSPLILAQGFERNKISNLQLAT
jgi:hypothetical protein